MNELTKTDLQFVVRRIPKDVATLLRGSHGLFLGGGFIRETIAGGDVKDIDLFGPDQDTAHRAANALTGWREDAHKHVSDNAITVLAPPRLPVQFITRWNFKRAEDLVRSFDFTVCRAAIWYEDGAFRSLIGAGFYEDLAARRLVYTFPQREEEAGGSFMRAVKFLKRGYTIQPEALGGVMARVTRKANSIDAHFPSKSERDQAVMIGNLLREVDPLVLVDGLELIDEHDTSLH